MVVGAGDPVILEADFASTCVLVMPLPVVLGADDLVDFEFGFVVRALLPAVVGAVDPMDLEVCAAADCCTMFVLAVRVTMQCIN
jgi:hypothetical protein